MRLDPKNPEDRKIIARIDGGKVLAEIDRASLPPREPEPREDGQGKSKYRNTRILREGEWFDSVYEWECWLVLKEMLRRREIAGLARQKKLDFVVNGIKVGWWTADYVLTSTTMETIYADAKHRATAAKQTWPRTKKLVLALYGTEVLVFYKGETDVRSAVLQRAADRGLM